MAAKVLLLMSVVFTSDEVIVNHVAVADFSVHLRLRHRLRDHSLAIAAILVVHF